MGSTPPPFEAKDKEGKLLKLSDFKEKVLLIDFWAAWCQACRVENPKLASLYQKYQQKGFEIISISQDETKENWVNAIQKDGIDSWHQIWDQDNSISEKYSVSSLPQNVLLDKKGKIIAKNVNAEMLSKILSGILD